ncbi:MAG: AI-2E family transporter [Terriglobales bacterium]|jgi:predicted PurR-regulated permease PerM
MIRRSDILFFFGVILALYAAWLARDVLLLIYISALFAVVLMPAINGVRRLRIGRWRPGKGMAIAIILLAGLTLLALFLAFVAPPIFHDAQAFAADWPDHVPQIVSRVHRLPFTSRINAASLQKTLDRMSNTMLGELFVFSRNVAGGVFWFFIWLILTLYFIADGERAFNWFLSLFPAAPRNRLEPTLLRAETRVQKWLIGQGVLMLMMGSASALVFGILGVKYFYALAVFAGLANMVPFIGPVSAAALASLLAGIDSWTKLFGVLIFYFVYEQIENGILIPRIMKSTLDLPPLAVIIALSVGGALAGILGALVAVPTAALVAVLLEEYVVTPHKAQRSP